MWEFARGSEAGVGQIVPATRTAKVSLVETFRFDWYSIA